LGGGVIKQRIARPGESKSKSELGNIREDEETQFKKMAKYVLSLTDVQLSELVANGQFEEVVKNA